MRRIITSLLVVGVVGAVAIGATQAFFSDTETSRGNVLSAGAIDLTIDSTAHYDGLICKNVAGDDADPVYQWELEEEQTTTGREDLLHTFCGSSWNLTDLNGQKFFNLTDLKPGDYGENTISIHVSSNDAYMCAKIDNMINYENDVTEPESLVDTTNGNTEGELSKEIHFFAWDDIDGDNVWESGEQMLFSNVEGPADDVIGGVVYPMFTPGNVLKAETPEYVGLYWCYGALTVNDGDNTLNCDGKSVTNLTQTDSLSADISFYVEQARNNDDFVCPTVNGWPVEVR